jgi:hypothetical protein
VRLVKDNYVGAFIVFVPSLAGVGAGAFFFWQALDALRRRFLSSVGGDQYL